jgi:hypothetical protein
LCPKGVVVTEYATAWMYPDFDPYSSAPAIGVPDFGPPPDVPIGVPTAFVAEPEVFEPVMSFGSEAEPTPVPSGEESAPITEES